MRRATNPVIEDLLELAGNFFGRARGAEGIVSSLVASLADRLDFVRRDEFDAAYAMLAKIRAEQDALDRRLAALEPQKKRVPPRAKPFKAARKKKS